MDWHHLLTEAKDKREMEEYLHYRRKVEIVKRLQEAQNNALKIDILNIPDSESAFKNVGVFSTVTDKYLKHSENYRTLQLGFPLIIDLDFTCTQKDEQASLKQILRCNSKNYRHPCGFHLHLTSVHKHREMYNQLQAGLMTDIFVDFHEKPFWELFPLERLVYVSPDAPMLRSFDGSDIYVMGGVAKYDGGTEARTTYTKAKELGIRVGSIPLPKYGQ